MKFEGPSARERDRTFRCLFVGDGAIDWISRSIARKNW